MNRSLLLSRKYCSTSLRRRKKILQLNLQRRSAGQEFCCPLLQRQYHRSCVYQNKQNNNYHDNKSATTTTTATATTTTAISASKKQQASHLHLSSSNPNETAVGNENKKIPSPCIKLDPRAIFPWRHSHQPLPRLIPNTPEFTSQGGYIGPNLPPWNVYVRCMSWINATGFLGGRILNYFGWKKELEEGFRLAFAVAVQGLLMDVYRVNNVSNQSKNENENNDNNIQESTSQSGASSSLSSSSSSAKNESGIPSIQFDHTINPLPNDEIPSDLNHDETINPHTRNMLESNLISLYKSAHEHMKHKLDIKLQSTPKQATIMSLMTIPFLTRDEVIQKPALKHSFRNVVKSLGKAELEKGSQLSYAQIMNHVAYELDELANRQMIRRGDGMMQVTVIAQVALQCDEIFKVVDIETGETVQGDADGKMQEVTHLVRFEVVVDLDAETGTTTLGTWQITDWDDLLDGNIWFL